MRIAIKKFGISVSIVLLLCTTLARSGVASPGIKQFGELPTVRSMSISPDGKHIAFVRENDDGTVLLVYALKNEVSAPVGIQLPDDIMGRTAYFVSNTQVVLIASDTVRSRAINKKVLMSASYVFSIETGQEKILLNKTRGLYGAQTGLGRIVGLNPETGYAYMPAFAAIGRGSATNTPINYLYRVSLDSGLGKKHARGRNGTQDWFVSRDGRVLARVDYDKAAKEHQIYSYLDGKAQLIYKNKTSLPDISIQAISNDEKQLLFIDKEKKNEGVFTINLSDGEIGGPVFARSGADISGLLTDINRKVIAVAYSRKPHYLFQDEQMGKLYGRVSASFPDSSIQYLSSTTDFSKILFRVSGNYDPHSFILFDAEKVSLNSLSSGYPDIKKEDLGEVTSITYEARDGLEIPAIITWPVSTKSQGPRTDLPLIVMPHGGPESHSSIGFDWLAQYFATKGYLILQPNFRGSTGYGREFMLAGRGKWGKEMQNDVTDGVSYLVDQGYVDPKRVCIIGGSYGGYSALAGGAFTPELYRCVVSINGISDLPMMLTENKRRYGARHLSNSYWQYVIGDSDQERDELQEVSPVNAAEYFMAPLLLIHGKDDTIVPIQQSQIMYKAMKKAGRYVELVTLDGEDHWLSSSETRMRALTEIDKFVLKQNPPD